MIRTAHSAAVLPRNRAVPFASFLSCGFRPFFLGAALWSSGALALWIIMLLRGATLPSRFGALTWHIHEMLFGFVTAAIAGFLLTAIPNWTQRPPVRGALLAALALLWLIGRIACLLSALMPAAWSMVADISFVVALIAVACRELALERSRRNFPLLLPLIVLGGANLLMHLQNLGRSTLSDLGWRLALAAIVVLISVIAGRIVPSFTANWLRHRGKTAGGGVSAPLERVALGSLHAGVVCWVFFPHSAAGGALLLLAAAANTWRLWHWRGYLAAREPLLLILHVGYGWLILGSCLLGLSVLHTGLPAAAGIHALTAGAMGTMILAVMTRATLGHTGRALHADAATSLLYGLVTLAALTRTGAALIAPWMTPLLVVSAVCWIGAFLGFVLCYGPMLAAARVSHA